MQGIRLVKTLVWEDFYTFQIEQLRRREVHSIKIGAVARGGLFSLIMFLPILASTLSFVSCHLHGLLSVSD